MRFSRELPLTSLISTILMSDDGRLVRRAGKRYSGNDHIKITGIMLSASSLVLVSIPV